MKRAFGVPPGRHSRVRRSGLHRGAGTDRLGKRRRVFRARKEQQDRSGVFRTDQGQPDRPFGHRLRLLPADGQGDRPQFPLHQRQARSLQKPRRRNGDQGDRRAGRRQWVRGHGQRRRLQAGNDHEECPARRKARSSSMCRLEPVVSGDVLAAGLGPADAAPYTRTWIILLGCLRGVGHRKGGANIIPPADHNALTPRGSLTALPIPTFRS